MARFVRIHEGVGLDRLQLDDLPMPEPKNDEVRIRVEAFALNYGDFGLMDNDYPFLLEFPSTFGDEMCGIVDTIPHCILWPAYRGQYSTRRLPAQLRCFE